MHRKRSQVLWCLLALGLSLVLSVPLSLSLAQTITSAGSTRWCLHWWNHPDGGGTVTIQGVQGSATFA